MRAKFQCEHVRSEYGTFEEVMLRAVYGGTTNAEDNQFSEATPSGDLHMTISNPKALGFFKKGQSYYLDFTPVND